MKLILATGIYPPEPGGPAVHVARFAKYLREHGHEVYVITYSRYLLAEVTVVGRHTPPGIRHVLYGFKLYRLCRGAQAIFAFDAWSAGLPAALVAELRAIPLVIRVGGDFLWEQSVNRRHVDVPLVAYYEKSLFNATERVKKNLIEWIIHKADLLVTPTAELCALYRTYYHIADDACTVIQNPMQIGGGNAALTGAADAPEALKAQDADTTNAPATTPAPAEDLSRTFIFAGRFVYLKNLHRLITAAAALIAKGKTNFHLRFVGSGPEEARLRRAVLRARLTDYITFAGEKSPEEVVNEIRNAHAAILISLSEVSPNFVLHALALDKPCIVTKYNGIKERIAPYVTHVDPTNIPEIVAAMEELIDPHTYGERKRAVAALIHEAAEDTDAAFLSAVLRAVSATQRD